MARTAHWAPSHRLLQRMTPGAAAPGNAPDSAPSFDYLSAGLQDHRWPWNLDNSAAGPQGLGWYAPGPAEALNYAPAAAATANIAALANVANGTPMSLVGTTGAGITVLGAGIMALPSQNTIPAGSLAIDGAAGLKTFGIRDFTGFYDPALMGARAISISGVSSGAGGAFLVSGADVYGYPMSQTITVAAGANTVNSTKAFKYIYSVTPQFADAHNYSVGTADIFGFPLYASIWARVQVYWNSALITASTGFVAGVTATATATTGDVRGSYAVQSASDGTKTLQVYIRPGIGAVQANPTAGLVGVPQA